MGKFRFITQIVLLLLGFTSLSQEAINTTIISPLQKDALIREKVFVHVNKTKYLPNETIWFTAYVGEDSTNKPSIYTCNLHVNLLNDNGIAIKSKTIFIKDGIGFGEFDIENDLPSGAYYIQAYSNFMRNFGDEYIYIQEIEIVGSQEKKPYQNNSEKDNYDIQIFPESGYLLENVENIIGIKALLNGKGYSFKGKIVNSKNEQIVSINGNFLGMGKCQFFYKQGESYFLEIEIKHKKQRLALPKALERGIIFSVNNSNSNKIDITIRTNRKSLASLKKDSLALLVYRNNYICQALKLSINNEQQTTQNITLNKDKLLDGVNIITLFKNTEPVAERKFFVEKSDKKTALQITEENNINDSIQYKIKSFNADFKPTTATLSIAVLSKNSKVFTEKQNIKSAFLLSPYVNGFIENPAYYFRNKSEKEKEFLDLLLINQGWTSYSLKEMIKKINPEKEFDFERGFSIHGSINKPPKNYDLGILSKKRIIAESNIINKKFTFKNVFAYKNDSLHLTLIKQGYALKKPLGISLMNLPIEPIKYRSITSKFNRTNIVEKTNSLINENIVNKPKGVEELDEVALGKVKLTKVLSPFEKELNLAAKHKVLAPSFYKNKKVTQDMELIYKNVFEYLQYLGYIQTRSGHHYIALRLAPMTIKSGPKTNPDKSIPPTVYIDDAIIQIIPMSRLTELKQLYMKDIDEILINKSGAGGGVNGAGGIIRIYTKKGDHTYFENPSENLYESFILKTGFDKAKSYYKPKYNIYNKEALNWIDIDWQPNLKTDKNGEIIFKVPINEFNNEHQLIINGISKDGLLFHTIYKTQQDDF